MLKSEFHYVQMPQISSNQIQHPTSLRVGPLVPFGTYIRDAPPPRIPVTTRIIIRIFRGSLLSFTFHCCWKGGYHNNYIHYIFIYYQTGTV